MDTTANDSSIVEKSKKPARRITFITGLLITLVGIRFLGSIFSIVYWFDMFSAIDTVIYLAAIVGITLKAKWGSLLVLVYCTAGFVLAMTYVLDFLLTFDYHIWQIHVFSDYILLDAGSALMYILIIIVALKEYANISKA